MNYWEKLLEGFSFKSKGGAPDFTNPNDRMLLRMELLKRGWKENVINGFLGNLRETEDKSDDSWWTKMSADQQADYIKKHPKSQKAIQAKEKEKEKQSKDKPKFDSEEEEQLTSLRNQDHETVDRELQLSKKEAEARSKEKGEKGVGAGTAESRAGEAATHKALRLLLEGKSYKEIESYLMNIAKDKNSVLTKEWVKGAINCTKYIEEKYGRENIKDIVWDTPSGRELINVEGHGTSSDMFLTLNDGKRVGISLKKDGKVFIVNGGYKKAIESMAEELEKKGVDSDKFLNGDPDDPNDEGVGIDSYRKDRSQAFANGAEELRRAFPVFNAALNDYMDMDGNITNPKKAKKDFGPNYEKYLKILNTDENGWIQLTQMASDGTIKGDQMKAISKLAKSNENVREYMSSIYGDMRQAEIDLTGRILTKAQNDKTVRKALKEVAVEGIHVDSILGLHGNDRLDEFITVYGEEGGAELSPETLVEMFGLGDLHDKFKSASGDEKLKIGKQIKKQVRDMIQFDFKDGARNGIVKINHPGPPQQEYPLFTIKARTKPIGDLPSLEMGQTTYMVNALKFGLDPQKWPSVQFNSMIRSQIKDLQEILDDTGGVGDGKDIQKQIEDLKAKLR